MSDDSDDESGEIMEFASMSMRWSIDTRACYPKKGPVFRFNGAKWKWYYGYRVNHYVGLQALSYECDGPFEVYVQVETGGTGRIGTVLSERKRFTGIPDNPADRYFCIWTKEREEVLDAVPEFRLYEVLKLRLKLKPIGDLSLAGDASACPRCRPSLTANQNATSARSIQCLESLSEDLSRYMDQGSDPDVKFKCGGQSTGVHSAIVCARSPVIASMLASDMAEGRTRVVKIRDMNPDVFQHFLRYIYTGQLPELTVDLALNLYESGDQYAVLGLSRSCSQYLLEHLSVENACDVLVIADAHSDGPFADKVIEYMLRTKVPLLSDRWSSFCGEHPQLANKLLNNVVKVVLK